MIIKALLQGDLEVVDGKLLDPQGILTAQPFDACDFSTEESPVQATQEAKPEPVPEITFSEGQVIHHPTFGEGKINTITSGYLKIQFECGEKIIGEKWAKENCNF